jgi:hypothetical protein
MQPEDLLNEGNNKESQEAAKNSPLVSLERDLNFFTDSIHEVAIEIMKLGELILDRHDLNSDWSIHASTLEEFTERGVIKPELKDRFINSYKNPNEYMCVFVVVPEGANFVYVPYKK